MLPADNKSEVVFLGGKDYVPLFCSLTSAVSNKNAFFYNSAFPPDAPGCMLRQFRTRTRTNWHYECADALTFTEGSLLSRQEPELIGVNMDERKLDEL
jgi:hypothetical protein